MKRNCDPDYLNEQYFEDWSANVSCAGTDGPFGSVIIQPDDPVEAGEHKHLCASCGKAWKHSDRMFKNEAAHTCPCGEVQWFKHFTY